ncbi:hypothetical protein IHE56_20360 [Streptomyces sp. ID01-12c]|uniref:hypothetical protein n=1 Tax=Streptomyces caniscabiei TaxID=2746961 RepID=UPI001780EC9F|nr:hypothetical protein [Streptomyces caniscabiei]MBD9704386.1 hypothetical protein [Streptomyces caniscabiei]MDX3732761.1 hypothetical protein [Streptomyces caniscabiei]
MFTRSPFLRTLSNLGVAGAAMLAVLAPAGAASAHGGSAFAGKSPVAVAEKDTGAAAAVKLRKLYDWRFHVKPNNAKYIGRPWKASEPMQELKRCFNCTFPVKNAPKKYPREGQLINLKACAAGPFGCRNAPVKFYTKGMKNGWYFIAQKGHFDGAGSRVNFQFYNDKKTGYLMLHVWAHVAKPSVPDGVNKSFARGKWQDFNHKMGVKMHCKHSSQC